MLGALILQVMERSEIESLKVMIYLIEGVLPKGYFSGSMGGLQADMAVFREILSTRLPKLSKHLQRLQGTTGESTLTVNLLFVFCFIFILRIQLKIAIFMFHVCIRFNGTAHHQRIYNAMVFDVILHVPAEKLCSTCMGSHFD